MVAALVISGLIVSISGLFGQGRSMQPANIVLPPVTFATSTGKRAFDAYCSDCHGNNAAGSAQGPPLLHDYYNPGHHPDASFQHAVRQGVKQHHWQFGDMPAQPQVTEAQVAAIIQYIRELQKANSIVYRVHRM
ncbi:MAG: cytochrome c [Burkholderiaceae bacterium]